MLEQEGNASYNAGARLPMDKRWYPQSRERTENERSFVDEHERASATAEKLALNCSSASSAKARTRTLS